MYLPIFVEIELEDDDAADIMESKVIAASFEKLMNSDKPFGDAKIEYQKAN